MLYSTFTRRSHSPGWDFTVEAEGRSDLVRVSTVAGALPLVTRAGKEERRRGEILMMATELTVCCDHLMFTVLSQKAGTQTDATQTLKTCFQPVFNKILKSGRIKIRKTWRRPATISKLLRHFEIIMPC